MKRAYCFFAAIFMLGNVCCAGQTLRQAAQRSGLMVGAALNVGYLSEPAYTSTLGREFNMVEPEDAMKWLVIRPNQSTFDFSAGDAVVGFAQVHGMQVRGHNLLWQIHNPDWLMNGHFTAKQLAQLMQEHITKVVTHYRGKVFAWDVVNEAIDEHGQLRHSIWYDKPGIGKADAGTAYIAQAFRWAHAADPNALLFYNDGSAEAINPHSDAIYAMVKDFRRRGVPIDGVGLQMHILDLNPDIESIAKNIARFGKLGVQVQLTEMDVAVPLDEHGNASHPEDLTKQAQVYREIAEVCVQNPACTALQTWGFTDKYSWIGWYTNHTKGDALLFDRRYQPKPAYEAVRAVLERSTTARRTRKIE
jgi:endo-1,4-beta-xylanase